MSRWTTQQMKSIKEPLLESQEGKCNICKEKLEGISPLDHIIPLADGGGSLFDNLQLLCPSCHVKKTAIENKERYAKLHKEKCERKER